jgi:hypothetical protein
MLSDPTITLEYVEILACVSVVIASLEMLVRPQELADDGLMSWQVAKLRGRWLIVQPVAAFAEFALNYPRILWIYRLRLLAAVLLVLMPRSFGAFNSTLAGLVFLFSLGQSARTHYGLDGADQMTNVTFLPLALAHAIQSEVVMEACLWFLALQSCLSYLTAGLAKAVSTAWRSEAALIGIFGTGIYGNESVAKFLRERPVFTKWLSRFITIGEVAFPLVMILPPPFNWLILIGGVAFHAASAFVMGLNTFFWSFTATYPAILFCADRLQSLLFENTG